MNERSDQGKPSSGDTAQEAPPTVWEWLAAGVGLVLLLASMVFLLLEHWRGDEAPPAPRVELVDVQAQQGQFLARVRVTNQSRRAAAALRVEGELRRGEEVVERSELELDYLPGRSAREGGLFFAQDPRSLQLVLRARSYQDP